MEGKLMLQILILTCFWWNSMPMPSIQDVFQPLPKPPLEPNSHISGPNGLCVEVKDNNYNDGNSIMLMPCMYTQVNQLWTFESDGTVRSNGKCLTTYGYRQGSYVMIYDCDAAVREATVWELKSDGEIVNTKSGLVLTAVTGTAGATLTVETSTSSSFQEWRVHNNTWAFRALIQGLKGLCLQSVEYSVWIGTCTGSVQAEWLLYQDGTIRPMSNPEWCLSYTNLVKRRVVVMSCGVGPSSQRWVFTENNTILNERDNLVMDVRLSDPWLKEIIVWEATGKPNQKWQVFLLGN